MDKQWCQSKAACQSTPGTPLEHPWSAPAYPYCTHFSCPFSISCGEGISYHFPYRKKKSSPIYLLMETLSHFPLAKLETITDLTFINFSTTTCRNVRKQLYEDWLITLITATLAKHLGPLPTDMCMCRNICPSIKIKVSPFPFPAAWYGWWGMSYSEKNLDGSSMSSNGPNLSDLEATPWNLERSPQRKRLLPADYSELFKQTLMHSSLRATLHVLVNHRS